MAFMGMVFMWIFLAILGFLIFEYFFQCIALSILFSRVYGEKKRYSFIPIYKQFKLYNLVNLLPILLVNYIVMFIPFLINYFNVDYYFTKRDLYIYIAYFVIVHLIVEFKLVKILGENKFWCILAIFFPNLTILINAIIFNKNKIIINNNYRDESKNYTNKSRNEENYYNNVENIENDNINNSNNNYRNN